MYNLRAGKQYFLPSLKGMNFDSNCDRVFTKFYATDLQNIFTHAYHFRTRFSLEFIKDHESYKRCVMKV